MNLTPKETQIAELISWGATEKEIANHLHKSIHTVRAQKRKIFEKTHSRNIADLTRFYFQTTSGIRLNPSEFIRNMLVVFALILITVAEFSNNDYCRTRSARARGKVIRTVAKRLRSKRDFELRLTA